jgi:polysaccharide biosynthesis transport protein
VGLLAAAAGGVAIQRTPARFTARSLVALRGIQQRRSQPLALQAGYEPGVVAEPMTGPTWVEWVNGYLFAERVAARLREEGMECAAFDVNLRVRASLLGENLVKIEAKDLDPARAKRFADTAAKVFLEESLHRVKEDMTGAVHWLEDRVGAERKEIEEAYLRIAGYKREHAIGDLRGEQESLLARLDSIEEKRIDAEVKLVKARARLDALTLDPEAPIPLEALVARDPLVGSYRQELAALRTRLVEAESQFAADHPKVLNLREEEQRLTSVLSSRLSELRGAGGIAPNPELLLEIADTLLEDRSYGIEGPAVLGAWNRAYERTLERYRSLPEHEAALERLQVAAELVRSRYQTLVGRLDDLAATRELLTGNAAIVDLAAPPKQTFPLSMRVAFVLGISLLLALTAGFVHEALDSTVHDGEELERVLGLGPLTVLPRLRRPDRAPALPSEEGRGEGRGTLGEPWRLLLVRLKFSGREQPFRTLLVAAANPGEGASTVATNLAATAAEFGERVVLVEGDLRRPCLASRFGVEEAPGLAQVLLEGVALEEALAPTRIPNLRLLPAGRAVTNPSELIASSRMRDLTEELKQHADLVVFDAPSVLGHAETAALASTLDAALLVARAGKVSRRDLTRGRQRLGETGARVLGVVLNAARGSPV